MKTYRININQTAIALSCFTLIASCSKTKDDNKDTEKPKVVITKPAHCDTVYLGESFTIEANLSDNVALGSYEVHMHHNFDQHEHSTQADECNLSAKKDPSKVNPFEKEEEGPIKNTPKEYTLSLPITIPAKDGEGKDYEPGDYHIEVSVADINGGSTLEIISVKVLQK